MPARLPEFPLRPVGPAASAFLERGVESYRDAAELVWRLPYGRGSGRDELRVLDERRGTCSTKHALLARLAREHSVAVELVLAIYMMDERNTPGVGSVLTSHGLTTLPEAHCLLRWEGVEVDLTRAGAPALTGPWLSTSVIAPEDIAEHKIAVHRRFMAQWMVANLPGWRLESLWRAREACIAALAGR
jgi:hypothetical protein